MPSLRAGHFVVVEGALYLLGFAEAKGPPRVTVAGGPRGPIGYGRGLPNRAYGRRIIESDCTTLLITGPRCKLLRLQEWTQPLHRDYGVGGHHKSTTLITVLRAASAAAAKPTHCTFSSGRKSGRLFIEKSLMGKESKTECTIVLCTHPLEIEVFERNVLSGSRVHSALKHRQFWLM